MFNEHKAAIGVSVIALLAMTVNLQLGDAAQRSSKESPRVPAGIGGTWQSGKQPDGPWIFNFQVRDDVITGKIWQEGGLTGPADIVDGRITGDMLTLRYRTPGDSSPLEVEFPGLTAPRPMRLAKSEWTIELTGVLKRDQIHFQSQGVGSSGALAAFANRPARGRMRGLFDPYESAQFSVKRAVPAVSGRVVVEDRYPRPVFSFQMVSSTGKRFSPLKRGNTWEGGVWHGDVNSSLVGSAFDTAARSPTVMTALGNPPGFIMRCQLASIITPLKVYRRDIRLSQFWRVIRTWTGKN